MSTPVALAAVFVAYGLIASRLERSLITAPIFFVAAGFVLGPSVIGIVPSLDSETTLVVTELTLGILLFADAATVRLREVEGDARLPVRLLFVGLPLTMVLGTIAAKGSSPRRDGRRRRSSRRSLRPPTPRSDWPSW